LVLAGLIIISILYFSSKAGWKYYKEKKKLVRLTADIEEEASSDKSNEDNKNEFNRTSQITTSDNPLG
jgi:hypothetical protein